MDNLFTINQNNFEHLLIEYNSTKNDIKNKNKSSNINIINNNLNKT